MKRLVLGGVLLLGLGLGGCSLFEKSIGVTTDPVTGQKSSNGTGGIAGGLLGIIVPGAPAIIAALAAVYANAKRKQWKDAALSTFEAVEAFKNSPAGQKVWDDLKTRLGETQAQAQVQEFVDAEVKKLNASGSA